MKRSSNSAVKYFLLILAVFIFVFAFTTAQAAEPTAIRLVVPHAAGSGADTYARVLSDRLAKVLGKPVVVENFPGAGGIKGMQEIIRAPKDGNTIGLTTTNVVIYPSIMKDLPYDPIKDVTPIAIIGADQFMIVANPSLSAHNFKELIALAKTQPGKLNYGSPGNGTIPHLAAALAFNQAGIDITHVPYKGGGQLTTDVMGGHIPLATMAVVQGVQQVKAGTIRALGVTGLKRHPDMPNVPTIAESGDPGFSYEGWSALIGPPNLPPAITKKINAALLEVLKMKEVRDAIAVQGSAIVGSTPEEAARVFKTDLEKAAKAVKVSGATFE
jgi:tripartite-type tricarboxylate transporter receptor subunit TctC